MPRKPLSVNLSVSKPVVLEIKLDIIEIEENLFVGGYEEAVDYNLLKAKKIKHIINCSPINCFNIYEKEFNYVNLEIVDTITFDIMKILLEITKLLDICLQNKEPVYVHCFQGISRAPCIVLSYLIYKKNVTVEEALFQVRQKYSKADPNIGFLIQLKQFYGFLNNPMYDSVPGNLPQTEKENMGDDREKGNFKFIQVME